MCLTAAVALVGLLSALNLASAPSKSADEPKLVFEEDCSTFAFSPDNHIAFGVRRADVTIVRGETGRRKTVRIAGATLAALTRVVG